MVTAWTEYRRESLLNVMNLLMFHDYLVKPPKTQRLLCVTHFNIHSPYILRPQCVYVIHIAVRTDCSNCASLRASTEVWVAHLFFLFKLSRSVTYFGIYLWKKWDSSKIISAQFLLEFKFSAENKDSELCAILTDFLIDLRANHFST